MQPQIPQVRANIFERAFPEKSREYAAVKPKGIPVRLSIVEKAYWEAYEESREAREALMEKSREYAAAKAKAAEGADGGSGG